MKKRILSLLLALVLLCSLTSGLKLPAHAAGDVAIDETNFPDNIFRNYVRGFDTDGNGSLSESERSTVDYMWCSYKGIASLEGIAHFPVLKNLYCIGNKLTSLDVSQNTALEELYCFRNQLTSLDVSKNTALKFLDCAYNQLTSLDVSKNTALKNLNSANNQLTSLDVSKNTALEHLACYDNQLTSLDVSKNTALVWLECSDNQLTSLDVSKNPLLRSLSCQNNQIPCLDLRSNLFLGNIRISGHEIDEFAYNCYMIYDSVYGDLYLEYDKTTTLILNPFTDVHEGDACYDAVLWAYYHQPCITAGMGDGTFGAGSTVNRGQAMTFLWAANGKPVADGAANPFEDVPDGIWYHDSVLWAVNHDPKITAGTDATHFSPFNTLNRGMMILFLYAAEGKPDWQHYNALDNPFSDTDGTYWHDAATWAYENGIDRGENGQFHGSDPCPRETVVMWLYRVMEGKDLVD